MKNLNKYINESKEQPLYSEYDIKDYFYMCLDRWLQNIGKYNIRDISDYSKVDMCKQCEIILCLIEKFSDDIHLHFYNYESEEERKKYNSYFTTEDSLIRVFKIITQLCKIQLSDIKGNSCKVDIDAEVKELNDRLNTLVQKCNNKYHKWYEEAYKGNGTAELCYGTPVCMDSDCCKCCSSY